MTELGATLDPMIRLAKKKQYKLDFIAVGLTACSDEAFITSTIVNLHQKSRLFLLKNTKPSLPANRCKWTTFVLYWPACQGEMIVINRLGDSVNS